ncbi:hypothetical protein SISNIDRAFT_454209, partial [Sistotremastrum niveocremeum HHB9708]
MDCNAKRCADVDDMETMTSEQSSTEEKEGEENEELASFELLRKSRRRAADNDEGHRSSQSCQIDTDQITHPR